MRAKILVTGATGFVGQELCKALILAGYIPVSVGRSDRAACLPTDVLHHRVDLESASLADQMVEGIDCVVHLAAQAHGKGGSEKQQFDGFRRANVDASVKLARLAINAGVRRFVFVSSIGVHGAATRGRAFSEASTFGPHSLYALSKLEAERELINLFESANSTELTIVRPPLVYGVQAPGNFASLLRLADSGIPLPFGSCSNRRNLISLRVLVDFLVACVQHPGAADQSFVVADTQAVSTADIVGALRRGMGRSRRLIPVPEFIMATGLALLGKRDMYGQLFGDLEIDNTKARSRIGLSPCEDTIGELELLGKRYLDSR